MKGNANGVVIFLIFFIITLITNGAAKDAANLRKKLDKAAINSSILIENKSQDVQASNIETIPQVTNSVLRNKEQMKNVLI